MWLFTREGFFSAVQNMHKSNEVMVRARKREDLEALIKVLDRSQFVWGKYPPEILEWTGTDYAYRIFIPREAWRAYLAEVVEDLTYTNFKASCIAPGDHSRSAAYHAVWSRLSSWQAEEDRERRLSSWRADPEPAPAQPYARALSFFDWAPQDEEEDEADYLPDHGEDEDLPFTDFDEDEDWDL